MNTQSWLLRLRLPFCHEALLSSQVGHGSAMAMDAVGDEARRKAGFAEGIRIIHVGLRTDRLQPSIGFRV